MARDTAYLEAEKKIEEARKTGATKLDLSQKWGAKDEEKLSLIAQLVPDNRPETELESAWRAVCGQGEPLQMQICRIVDDKGQSASARGLVLLADCWYCRWRPRQPNCSWLGA